MNLRLWLILSLPLLVLPACGSDDPKERQTATIPALTEPPAGTPSVKVHPAGTRTGHPSIDAALDAIERSDSSGLTSQLAVVTRPCTRQPGNAIVCGPGQSDGTMVDIIAFGRCQYGQSQIVLRKDAASEVAAFLASRPSGLVAVARTGTSAYYGPYGVSFASGHLVLLDDTGVTAFLPPCPGVTLGPPPIGPSYILAPP